MSTSEIPYHFEAGAGYSVVTLHPVLNDSQWADIERVGNEVCEKYSESGSKSVMVDLSELKYMGSAMVALIVRLWKSVKEKNGKMVVVNEDEMVFEVLKLAGLHKVWTIVEDREEGFSNLGVSRTALAGGGATTGGGNGNALLITGVIALVGAVAGLLMLTQGGGLLGSPKTALMLNVLCSLISLVVGMMLIMKHSDHRQKAGMGIAGVGIIALLAGIMMDTEPAPAQEKTETPAPSAVAPVVTPAAAPVVIPTQPASNPVKEEAPAEKKADVKPEAENKPETVVKPEAAANPEAEKKPEAAAKPVIKLNIKDKK